MKRPSVEAALLAAALATASPAALAQAAPGDAQQLATRQTVALAPTGAIAAFAVDPTIVDVSVDAGKVFLLGRRAGDTVVTVVLAGGVESFRVHVDPAVVVPDIEALQAGGRTMVEARYDSALHRFTGAVSGRGQLADYEVRAHLEAVRQMRTDGGQAPTALPAATIELTNSRRSIVLLDKFVQDSRLTLDGVVVRGVHLREGAWEAHAGIASWSPLQGFLSSGGERAVTLARAYDAGAMRITPRLAWLPDSRSAAKALSAVSIDVGRPADALHVRAEAGLSGGPAAALDVDWRTPAREAWLRASARPRDFAALKAAQPPGTQAEGAWTERLDEATTASVSGSASRLEIAQTQATSLAARAELRRQLDEHWSATATAGGGDFRSGLGDSLRRATVGAGVSWDSAQWGASALYRYQTTSVSDTGGHGGRISLRAGVDGWSASAFVDVQQQSPTLDLLLRDRGDLAQSLASLGIAAAQPEDILRALRDNAGLITRQNLQIGPVRLNPLRTYAGIDATWRGRGASKPEIGVRLLRDHVEGIVGARSATVASVHASWRVSERTDVGIALSRWSTQREGQDKIGDTGVQVNVRTFLDQPLISPASSPAIAGQVFREDTPGESSGARAPLAGIEVVLDRSRRTRTDAQGRYEFERPGAGSHVVEAVLPAQGAAYFTTPSSLTREAGGNADFGIAMSGVRVTGVVRNDGGMPLAGVAVHAEGASSASAVTDSKGVYRLTVAPGDVRFSLAADTVPAGHDLRTLPPRERRLRTGEPATVNFVVRAMRSLEGTVAGADGKPTTVAVLELSRSVQTDARGHFVMRGLPAGSFTLLVGEDQTPTRVDVPEKAGVVRGVTLRAR